MNRTTTSSFVLAAAALLSLAAFQIPTPTPPPQDPPKPAPAPAPVPAPAPTPKPDPAAPQRLPLGAAFRIAGFHGADKEKEAKQYAALIKWLSADLARPVEIVPVEDEAAAISGLLGNKIEMAWLSGQGAVRADAESKGFCWTMFAREEDVKSKSYFIASKKLVDAGTFSAITERKPMGLEQLAALKPKFAALSFEFGAKTSTSGHLMPRWFFERPEVAIDPEKNFKQKPTYAPSAGDAGVLAAVGSGGVDIGVISASAWEHAKDDEKSRAPVIYVTPEYLDSSMVLYNRVGPTLSFRVLNAFLKLDPKVEEQKAVLELFGTQRFVHTDPRNFDGLREVLKSAKERKLLE